MEVVAIVVDKINPIFANPFTQLWWVIHAFQLLSHYFSKYLKLVEIARVHIFGFINDEAYFSSIFFLKNKLHNLLDSHLQLHYLLCMHKSFSCLRTFHTKLCG
jgi:hypothetical protein